MFRSNYLRPTLVHLSPSQQPSVFLPLSLQSKFTLKMQFAIPAVLGFAALAAALPPVDPSAGGIGNANGLANKGNTQIRFPVPDDMTVKQAQAKCGDQAQVSCCNHATYAGDTTDVNKGLLAGTLSHLLGTGSGAEGLGLFDQCSQVDVQCESSLLYETEDTINDFPVPALHLAQVQDLIKKKCHQNIACCQNSPSDAVSIILYVKISVFIPSNKDNRARL